MSVARKSLTIRVKPSESAWRGGMWGQVGHACADSPPELEGDPPEGHHGYKTTLAGLLHAPQPHQLGVSTCVGRAQTASDVVSGVQADVGFEFCCHSSRVFVVVPRPEIGFQRAKGSE